MEFSPLKKISLCILFLGLVIAPMLNKVVTVMTVLFSYIRDECSQQSALTTINCAHAASLHRSISEPFLFLDLGRSVAKLFGAKAIQVSGLPAQAGQLGAAAAPKAYAEGWNYCGCLRTCPRMCPVTCLIPARGENELSRGVVLQDTTPSIPRERWRHVLGSC